MGICTNKPTEPARAICDALVLTQFFDVIFGAEQGMSKKPDAAPLLGCMTELGGSIETTSYIGDSAVDYHTALNAGMDFRLFTEGYLNEPLVGLPEKARFREWSKEVCL